MAIHSSGVWVSKSSTASKVSSGISLKHHSETFGKSSDLAVSDGVPGSGARETLLKLFLMVPELKDFPRAVSELLWKSIHAPPGLGYGGVGGVLAGPGLGVCTEARALLRAASDTRTTARKSGVDET